MQVSVKRPAVSRGTYPRWVWMLMPLWLPGAAVIGGNVYLVAQQGRPLFSAHSKGFTGGEVLALVIATSLTELLLPLWLAGILASSSGVSARARPVIISAGALVGLIWFVVNF